MICLSKNILYALKLEALLIEHSLSKMPSQLQLYQEKDAIANSAYSAMVAAGEFWSRSAIFASQEIFKMHAPLPKKADWYKCWVGSIQFWQMAWGLPVVLKLLSYGVQSLMAVTLCGIKLKILSRKSYKFLMVAVSSNLEILFEGNPLWITD